MHAEVDSWIEHIKAIYPSYFVNTSVVEIGSRIVNGSVRKHFRDCAYTGLDLSEGPGVDVVRHAVEFAQDNEARYHVVISTEALEHDARYADTLRAMWRLARHRGLVILTCAGPAREEHGTRDHTPEDSPATLDHYQNLTQLDIMEAFGNGEMITFDFMYGRGERDVYFAGIKRGI